MAVNAGDIIGATVLSRFNNVSDVQNVYTVRVLSAVTTEEADVLEDLIDLFEALYTILAPIISVLTTFNGIRAVNRSALTDIGVADFSALTVGSAGGDSMPPQCCTGVTLYVPTLGRFGRKFIGVPSETNAGAAGLLAAGTITVAASFAAELLENQVAASGNVYQFGIGQDDGSDFLQFTSAAVTPTVVTQRRRRAGVGS